MGEAGGWVFTHREDARHRVCRVRTYKRDHCTNQIDDGVQPIWAEDFLVTDFLADGEVTQSKKLNVGVVRVIALRFLAVSKGTFSGSILVKLATCENLPPLIASWAAL